jgi:alpha-L-fucosidase
LARRKALELNDKICKDNKVGFYMGLDEHKKLLQGKGDWATVNRQRIHNDDDLKVFESMVAGKVEHRYSSPMKNRLANIIINDKREKSYMMNRDRYSGNEAPSGPKEATTQKAKPQVATKLANKMSKQGIQ